MLYYLKLDCTNIVISRIMLAVCQKGHLYVFIPSDQQPDFAMGPDRVMRISLLLFAE